MQQVRMADAVTRVYLVPTCWKELRRTCRYAVDWSTMKTPSRLHDSDVLVEAQGGHVESKPQCIPRINSLMASGCWCWTKATIKMMTMMMTKRRRNT